MKILKLTFIFAIIGYCIIQIEAKDCKEEFEELVKGKCEAIGSCSYDTITGKCVDIKPCQQVSETDCGTNNPPDFIKKKCIFGTSCTEVDRTCGEYDVTRFPRDNCTELKAPTSDQRCALIYGPTITCKAQYDQCLKIETNDNRECEKNVPKDPTKKCEWDSSANIKCQEKKRACDETNINYYVNKDIDICSGLIIKDTVTDYDKKQCIYSGGACIAEYKTCQQRPDNDCDNHYPLKTNDYTYDYTKKCVFNSDNTAGNKCQAVKLRCDEYITIPAGSLNEAFCNELETSENYFRCAYDGSKCYEEYRYCENYTTYKVETTRQGCQDIVLRDKNQECVYDYKEDKCFTKAKYSNCIEYKGKDKKICESILSSENEQYCILDKDSECIEKPINCTEAHNDEEKCLKIAKASDSNKRCAFKSGECVEEYIRCEDFLGVSSTSSSSSPTSQSVCRNIRLYDGKKCDWISTNTGTSTNFCSSQFKKCEEATTEEECKLIAKIGVADPERKVCDWLSSCFPNYKYCSDYRGNNSTICENIKPYDESGSNIAFGFKCHYENGVGCQRVPVECKDAKNNTFLCEAYNEYIKDKDKKHCVLDGIGSDNNPSCRAHYKKCEYFENDPTNPSNVGRISNCRDNIIEGYIRGVCDDSTGKCEQKKLCNLKFVSPSSSTAIPTPFLPNSIGFYYKGLCEKISYNCSYDISSGTCEDKVKDCEEITFYTNDTNNKDICENIEVSKPYKKCSLKEDLSGCEEVYREFNFSAANNSYSTPPDASSQGNSSGFIEEGIHLLMALLSLLI